MVYADRYVGTRRRVSSERAIQPGVGQQLIKSKREAVEYVRCPLFIYIVSAFLLSLQHLFPCS